MGKYDITIFLNKFLDLNFLRLGEKNGVDFELTGNVNLSLTELDPELGPALPLLVLIYFILIKAHIFVLFFFLFIQFHTN